jgi:hypothetical protein
VIEDWVAFRIRDVYLPEGGQVKEDLTGEALLIGRIQAYSDSGSDASVFVVVEVTTGQRVIVPVERLVKIEGPVWSDK